MPALFLPLDGELVTLEVPRALTSVARTVLLESSFHRRTGVRVRWPDRWARAIAERVVAERDDPVRWVARQAELARRTAMARRMAPESRDVALRHVVDRLLEGRLEDGSHVTGAEFDALRRTTEFVVGHGRRPKCPTCRLLDIGDVSGYLRNAGCDAVLLRILHAEAQQAELLPAYLVRAATPDGGGEYLSREEIDELLAEDDAA